MLEIIRQALIICMILIDGFIWIRAFLVPPAQRPVQIIGGVACALTAFALLYT